MDPIITSVFIALAIMLLAVGIKKEIEQSKRLKRRVARYESSDLNSVLSTIPTKELVVSEFDGLMLFSMSCRMMTKVNHKHIAFTIRAKVGDEVVGFRFYIIKDEFTINVLDTGEEEKVYGVNMFSNVTESDSFLDLLLNTWLIEKIGKPRMKSEIAGYAYLDEHDFNRFENECVDFIWNMGVTDVRQLEPRLGIRIDWQKGLFEIYEVDVILRELLINRIMM